MALNMLSGLFGVAAATMVLIGAASNPEDFVTTSLSDAYQPVALLDNHMTDMEPTLAQSLDTGYGYFRIPMESYCLHAGTYGPTQGDGYLMAPLKGQRANLVSSVLQQSFAHADISQYDIQILIWGIEAGERFSDYPAEFQARLAPLLNSDQIAKMNEGLGVQTESGGVSGNAQSVLGNLIPSQVTDVLATLSSLRDKLSDPEATYDDIANVAVRQGKSPGESEVDSGHWAYIGNGAYMRAYPQSYPDTTIEILRPATPQYGFDNKGRIVNSQVGNLRVDVTYDDAPGNDRLALDNGQTAHVWRFKSITAYGPKPGDRHVIKNQGWVIAGDDVSRDTIANARLNSPQSQTMPGRSAHADVSQAQPNVAEYASRISDLQSAFRRIPPGFDPQKNLKILDILHYELGLEATYELSFAKEGQWIHDQMGAILQTWAWGNCMLGGCFDRPHGRVSLTYLNMAAYRLNFVTEGDPNAGGTITTQPLSANAPGGTITTQPLSANAPGGAISTQPLSAKGPVRKIPVSRKARVITRQVLAAAPLTQATLKPYVAKPERPPVLKCNRSSSGGLRLYERVAAPGDPSQQRLGFGRPKCPPTD